MLNGDSEFEVLSSSQVEASYEDGLVDAILSEFELGSSWFRESLGRGKLPPGIGVPEEDRSLNGKFPFHQ